MLYLTLAHTYFMQSAQSARPHSYVEVLALGSNFLANFHRHEREGGQKIGQDQIWREKSISEVKQSHDGVNVALLT